MNDMVGEYEFDKDLIKGKWAEKVVVELINKHLPNTKKTSRCQNKKYDVSLELPDGERITIEVKRDMSSHKTGNVALEYWCRGRESGIAATSADFVVYVFGVKDEMLVYVFQTNSLRSLMSNTRYRDIMGGDKWTNSDGKVTGCSKMILVPVRDFIRAGVNLLDYDSFFLWVEQGVPIMAFERDFKGELAFLSNMWCAGFKVGRFRFKSVEHYYQSVKARDEIEAKWVLESDTPFEAKRRGKSVAVRDDWESIKLDVMSAGVRAKFTQNRELADKLLATGSRILEEGNSWGDLFWGVDFHTRQGENHLGKILMQVRQEIHDGRNLQW